MSCNPWRGEVLFNLGQQTLILRPSFDAIARIEQGLGTSLPQLVNAITRRGLHARELLAILIHAGGTKESSLHALPVSALRSPSIIRALAKFFRHAVGSTASSKPAITASNVNTIPAEFPWADLLTLALAVLQLPPTQFWNMTPAEFRLLLDGLRKHLNITLPPTRDELLDLMRKIPDMDAA